MMYLQLADWMRALSGATIGAIVGSFIGALCSRWPAGHSVMAGRSRCGGCAKILPPRELVPVISFLALSGRCARCSSPIGRSQLFAEIAAMVIGAAAFLQLPPGIAVQYCLLGWMLLTLTILDFKYLWLPSRLTAALALLGIGSGLLLNSEYNWALQIGAASFCWTALELLRLSYRRLRGRDGMGAGDPKLLAALALWTPPAALPPLLLMASILGLIFALIMQGRWQTSDPKLPFGGFLAASALIINWPGSIFQPG